MKRKITKKRIRRTERLFAQDIRQYLSSLSAGDSVEVRESSIEVCWTLTLLLSDHLELGSSWPHKQRWLDGIIEAEVSAAERDGIAIRGWVVWGLSENPGGKQWAEPFQSEIQAPQRRRYSYRLRFGDAEGLPNKLIEFGLYEVISLQKQAVWGQQEYSYEFRRPKAGKRVAGPEWTNVDKPYG